MEEKKQMTINELVQTEGWKNFTRKLEIASAFLLVLSIIFLIIGAKDRVVFTMALSTFSVLCYFMGFLNFESDSKVVSLLFYKIYGWGLAIGFTTILFTMQKWPFPKDFFVPISLVLISISIILGYREITSENKNKLNWIYFLRLLVGLIPLLYILIQKI